MKIAIVIEDQSQIKETNIKLLKRYDFDVKHADNGDEALSLLKEYKEKIDVIFLDLMLPYGSTSAIEELNSQYDKDEIDTGVRILKYVRKELSLTDTWVAVITARRGLKLTIELEKLLGKRGKIYYKPFDDFLPEADMAYALSLECKVPKVFLPDDYQPPQSVTSQSMDK